MSSKTKVLVVVVALAACAGVAWGLKRFIRTRSVSSYASCITLLREIDGAKQQWALEHSKATNDIPTWADLVGPDLYMRQKPICPQGGTYTLGRVDEYPRCSIVMHSLNFGMVAVVDETGAPLGGAYVSVQGFTLPGEPTLTDTNGHAVVTHWSGVVVDDWSRGTNAIKASLAGYETGRVALPSGWPAVITMRREHK